MGIAKLVKWDNLYGTVSNNFTESHIRLVVWDYFNALAYEVTRRTP